MTRVQAPSGASAAQHPPLTRADRCLFYVTASITGATVMMIELLGTRIIGPYYGVSMIVWSSLLSTALLALAIGYLVGGRLADTAPWLRLSHILLATGVLIGIIPLISQPVQLTTNALGLRWGALSSAFVLFTPCLIMLGMVGPYVIKMATSGLERLGRTAGTVYAISTLGSVAGTLLLGFYLLPLFGTQRIVVTLSVLMFVMAFILALYENRRLRAGNSLPLWGATTAGLAAFVLVGVAGYMGQRETPGSVVVFEAESPYAWVRVVDQPERGIRWLMSGGSTIGAEHLASGQGVLGYQAVVGQLPLFNRLGRDALLVGLGSGHLVNTYAQSGIATDAMEIDPVVAQLASEYFSFVPTGDVIVGDARYQIQQMSKQYDFIVHDCFTGGAEPIHLLSLEMFQKLKARLKPGGILALNFVGLTAEGEQEPVEAVAKTLDQVFPHRRTFVSAPDAEFNDYVFFVSNEPLVLTRSPDQRAQVTWLERLEVDVRGESDFIITDDYNPLETLHIAKAEYYRDMLVERVGESLLFY
ncbi:fused MFS/spermidine synthase [Marinimicrobium alkaliphilum]|uniref:fused MFS/spermidine synthase n=1 Tax=Marinimicrobium alkaliphilum TaxID=2202654 RepID=UPI0018E09C75|nr:fused MFS/spermidine synthase [Marinimicrobium alkaliphilum]